MSAPEQILTQLTNARKCLEWDESLIKKLKFKDFFSHIWILISILNIFASGNITLMITII